MCATGRCARTSESWIFAVGLLQRSVEWASQSGVGVQVRSTRLVSLVQRSVAAVSYEVEALDAPVRIVVQSELVANDALPPAGGDPRVSAVLEAPLHSRSHACGDAGAALLHCTAGSGLRIAAAMEHRVEGPSSVKVSAESFPDLGRVTVTAVLEPGERLRLVKFVAYGWSSERSEPAVRDQVAAALTAAQETGWEGLVVEQRAYLDDFWAARMSRSTVTPGSSRQCASLCSTSCRPGPGPRDGPSRRKA